MSKTYTEIEWAALCAHYGNVCLCCGESKPLTKDHIIPTVKGGADVLDNLQPLCSECNTSKMTNVLDLRPDRSSVRCVPTPKESAYWPYWALRLRERGIKECACSECVRRREVRESRKGWDENLGVVDKPCLICGEIINTDTPHWSTPACENELRVWVKVTYKNHQGKHRESDAICRNCVRKILADY